MRLSVLDQSIAVAGRPHDESIRDTLALAQACDKLGYHRFWVSEHHNHPTIVGSAPEILIAAMAATTERIRIGSAGVLLPHYSALKVAEQFRVIEAIAPGRVDLGVGRAPGSDGRTAFALNPNAVVAAEAFPAQLRDLQAWVTGGTLPEDHPFRTIAAHPRGTGAPEVWVLGSSDYGARVAAHFGLPYCFAHFITDGRGAAQALDIYRQTYRPSAAHPEPTATVCVWALAAETEAEAERLFTTRQRWRLARDRGLLGPLRPPEELGTLTGAEREQAEGMRRNALVGSVEAVAGRLRDLAASLDVDELVILTWAYDETARRGSYELLARAFSLAG